MKKKSLLAFCKGLNHEEVFREKNSIDSLWAYNVWNVTIKKKQKNTSEYIQKPFIIEAEECKCTFLENFGVSLFVSITKSKYTYMLAHNPLSR